MIKNPVHALLAVETDLKNVASKILLEAGATFSKKGEHFDGIKKIYINEDESAVGSNQGEIREVVTTVGKKINYAKTAVIAGLNAQLSKEQTNASGTVKSALVVGDVDFGELSATALLSLEKEMVKIRKMYEAIPTLDPGKSWKRDEEKGKGMWKTDASETFRTGKKTRWITVSEATKEHPAQNKEVTEDVQVGRYMTHYESGKVTPLEKSNLLERIDAFILGVKKARSLANQVEVIDCKIGDKIFDYINSGIL